MKTVAQSIERTYSGYIFRLEVYPRKQTINCKDTCKQEPQLRRWACRKPSCNGDKKRWTSSNKQDIVAK